MPKRQPKNAYYFFMIDFREEQKKKGITYQNLAEVQVAADPAWRQGHPAMRAKYEAMAKAEKERLRGAPDKKFTSNGVSLAEIEAEQRMLLEIQEQEIIEIKNFVSQKHFKEILLEADIFLIDVNAYCFAGSHYFMAESTVLRFNLCDGITQFYHEGIHPGRIPIGFASDVKLGAIELGLEMPDEDNRSDFPKILACLMDFLKQNSEGNTLPALYTLTEKVEQVQDFIRQLCNRSGEDFSNFRVYKLDNLFFHLVNEIRESPEDGYPKASLATTQLKKDPFKYTPGLACERHEASDKAVECSKSRVQRWAFTVLDKCCPVAGIEPVPGRHVPVGLDVESVLSYKEQRSESAISSVMGSSRSSTVGNVSYETVSNAWDKKSLPSRTHKPLRLPKTDFSRTICPAPELDVNERNFPTLMGGAGRGRSISREMKKMTLDE